MPPATGWQAAEKLIGTVILRSQQAVLSLAKEESRIAVNTLRARSFAAAEDDSMGAFFRSLLGFIMPITGKALDLSRHQPQFPADELAIIPDFQNIFAGAHQQDL